MASQFYRRPLRRCLGSDGRGAGAGQQELGVVVQTDLSERRLRVVLMRRAPRTGSSVPPFPPAAIAPAASHVGGCDLASVFVPNTCNNHLISYCCISQTSELSGRLSRLPEWERKRPTSTLWLSATWTLVSECTFKFSQSIYYNIAPNRSKPLVYC